MSTYFDEMFDKIHSQKSQQIPEKEEENISSFDQIFEKVKQKAPSKARSLISAPVKGLIKGASKFSPLPSFGPVSQSVGEELTERFLPTLEGDAEDVLEFAGENIPLAAMGEGGLVKRGIQAATGAFAKKGAKEIGLPDWAQEIVGSAGMVAPDAAKSLASKTIRSSSKQKPIVDFLKSHGLDDKDITPIIQDKKKLSFFSKAANKFEKEEPWLKGIKSKLGGIFEGIRERGNALHPLEGKSLSTFENEFLDKLDKVPRMYRGLIKKEVDDLFSNPITFTELHDFDKAVNAIVRDVEGGKAAIGILKEPVKKAQKDMAGSLFEELQQTNHAYSKLLNYTDKMTKSNWDSLLNLGQAGQALYGVLTLNPAALKAAGLVAASKMSAKQILSNPRLQNIHLKMWDAFLKNNVPQALKLMQIMNEEIQGKSPKESESQ